MKDIWNYLKESKKPIVLYGMGNGADKIISVCDKYGIKISGVFSSDGFVRKKTFHGMPVTDYRTAKEMFGDMTVLLCFGTALPEVIFNIKNIAKENELYAPDVPVYGDALFCEGYHNDKKADFNYIYNLLADKISKNVFSNVIKYKLTGDIKCLFSCETDCEEPYQNFLKLSDKETYLDLGAYRGDTVLSFCNRAKNWNSIVAVEPDKKTYEKLKIATLGIKGIKNINAFAGAVEGTAAFNMNGSRGVGKGGTRDTVEMITVDSINIAPTFIKMDIEGAEAAAIKGSQNTIKKYKPKMQIAAYHRSEDLIDIPKTVLGLVSDYKIYLRHNPCLPAWDVNYFFV